MHKQHRSEGRHKEVEAQALEVLEDLLSYTPFPGASAESFIPQLKIHLMHFAK